MYRAMPSNKPIESNIEQLVSSTLKAEAKLHLRIRFLYLAKII